MFDEAAVPKIRPRISAESPAHNSPAATMGFLQQNAGNAAVQRLLNQSPNSIEMVQRQDDSGTAGDGSDEPAPEMMCSPPIAEEEVLPDEDVTEAPDDGVGVQALGEPMVQRQPTSGTTTPPVKCSSITFASFPKVDPADPAKRSFGATTAYRWSFGGKPKRFGVSFNAAASWVRPSQVKNTQLERHEQYHLRLVCTIADIANRMLDRGDASPTSDFKDQVVRTMDLQTINYDDTTNHGLNAAMQSAVENAIDIGQVMMAP